MKIFSAKNDRFCDLEFLCRHSVWTIPVLISTNQISVWQKFGDCYPFQWTQFCCLVPILIQWSKFCLVDIDSNVNVNRQLAWILFYFNPSLGREKKGRQKESPDVQYNYIYAFCGHATATVKYLHLNGSNFFGLGSEWDKVKVERLFRFLLKMGVLQEKWKCFYIAEK